MYSAIIGNQRCLYVTVLSRVICKVIKCHSINNSQACHSGQSPLCSPVSATPAKWLLRKLTIISSVEEMRALVPVGLEPWSVIRMPWEMSLQPSACSCLNMFTNVQTKLFPCMAKEILSSNRLLARKCLKEGNQRRTEHHIYLLQCYFVNISCKIICQRVQKEITFNFSL